MELFKFNAKCRPSKSDADHQLKEGKCTDGGHQQFLMNNSSDNIVWQFRYGGFNGVIHLLMECGRKGRGVSRVVRIHGFIKGN